MKQFTWMQADELSRKAAERAAPFWPRERKLVDISDAKVQQDLVDMMARSAFVALRLAGNLDLDDRQNAERTNRLAELAEREHQAWCKATGNRF
jgi:hypothetical protein